MTIRLPTSFRYGARAMAELGAAEPDHAVSVRELGQRQSVSPKYLEQILRALKAAGLVQAVRGKDGGYMLARAPESITLRDVYESLAGPAAPTECVDGPAKCPLLRLCPTRDTWVELKAAIDSVLERTTIQELVERKRRKATSAAADFSI
jgi:Rrf2 family transcriptional regulator, cysteine metabolism repressor